MEGLNGLQPHLAWGCYGCVDILSDRWVTHAQCPSPIVTTRGTWYQRHRARLAEGSLVENHIVLLQAATISQYSAQLAP